MNIILWILQIGISIKLIITAFSHSFRCAETYNRPTMLVASILLLLCAAGLIVPGAFKFVTWITPLAAAILVVVMVVALVLHLKCPEHSAIYADIVIILLAVVIAVGRKFITPL